MSPAAVFAFGKLPSHGDFVARGLSAAAQEAWDDWAAAGLAEARAGLGASFEAAHDAAPPWRFVFGPGRFGRGWRAGAFASSIDRAGRRFIVVLGVETVGPLSAEDGETLAEQMENQIYDAFAQGRDIDAMVAAAAGVTDTPAPSANAGSGRFWTLGGAEHAAQTLTAIEPPADLLRRALASGSFSQ